MIQGLVLRGRLLQALEVGHEAVVVHGCGLFILILELVSARQLDPGAVVGLGQPGQTLGLRRFVVLESITLCCSQV